MDLFVLFIDHANIDSNPHIHQNVECHLDAPTILRGDASDRGRFGSSLAVLPDLNADGFNDLAVGAPLENDNQGCIYIFHGEGGGRISTDYSQVSETEFRLTDPVCMASCLPL